MTTVCLMALVGLQSSEMAAPGQLTCIGPDGKPGLLVPLEKTKVFADIGGIGARVTVIQTFRNTSREPIEAVYTFPLPDDGAVDRMRMRIADRLVEGEIKERGEARAIYDAAKARGQVAGLLEQQRSNIFTQSVANLMPGAEVNVEISYVHQLKYEDDRFEFVFPMVVGPRFIPQGVADGGVVNPAVMPPDVRSGSKISLEVTLDPGAKVSGFESPLHEITATPGKGERVHLKLNRADVIPNRDFVLRYSVAGAKVKETFMSHFDQDKKGVFCLSFVPPREVKAEDTSAKEVIFVMDQSGSQRGFPIEKSKELTLGLLNELRQDDMFNVVSFANETKSLWERSQPVTDETLAMAREHVKGLQAGGGTYFLPAVKMAYGMPEPVGGLLRMVVFNTDGYVGNEYEILAEIQKRNGEGRMFTFGIGNSVNRFLIDAMSVEGRGDDEVITLEEKADDAIERFVNRTRSPLLTDVSVSINGVVQGSVTPGEMPDVFSEKPVTVMGRYDRPGPAKIVVSGKMGGKPWSKTFDVVLGNQSGNGKALQSLWARRKVEDLKRERWMEMARPRGENDVYKDDVSELVRLCLRYGIMSEWTSFVAVEKRVVNFGGKQRTVAVPVDRADGVSDLAFTNSQPMALGRSRFASKAAPTGGAGGGGINAPTAASEMADTAPAGVRVSKISKKLEKAKGQVEIQVRVKAISAELKRKLKALGFKLEDEDKGLKVLFGSVDAQKLKEIAKIESVVGIDPL